MIDCQVGERVNGRRAGFVSPCTGTRSLMIIYVTVTEESVHSVQHERGESNVTSGFNASPTNLGWADASKFINMQIATTPCHPGLGAVVPLKCQPLVSLPPIRFRCQT